MPRSHHRKKHREHVRNFRQHQEGATTVKAKSKGSTVFAFAGVAVGLLLGYLASNGNIIWAISGLVAGGVIGYIVGRKIDTSAG